LRGQEKTMRFLPRLLLTMLAASPVAILPGHSEGAQEQPATAHDDQPTPAADSQGGATVDPDRDPGPGSMDNDNADSSDRRDPAGGADVDAVRSDAPRHGYLYLQQVERQPWLRNVERTPEMIAAADALENCLATGADSLDRRPTWNASHVVVVHCQAQVENYRQAGMRLISTLPTSSQINATTQFDSTLGYLETWMANMVRVDRD
jgi:hypothetical protein